MTWSSLRRALQVAAIAASVATSLTFAGALSPRLAAAAASPQVSAWTFGAQDSLRAATAAGAIDEVQTDAYTVSADGSLSASSVDPAFVGLAHGRGCRVLATVSNWSGGDFSPGMAHAILSSGAARAKLVAALDAACASLGYDGVDLDFESVRVADRDALSSFVEQLARALHGDGRTLAFAASAKTGDTGAWFGAASEDYARLGAAVDEFQVMTYAYSGPWGKPGPIAPPGWTDRVLDYAQTQVPAEKLWMGLPFYGCDWSPAGAAEITWRQATRRLRSHHATVVRTPSREARFTYRDRRGRHTVFFQDRASLTAKLAVLTKRHPGIAGVAIWVMGGEDPRFWPLLARRLAR